MQKRGQITLIAVVAIVLVIVLLLFAYTKFQFAKNFVAGSEVQEEAKNIEKNIEDCISDLTESGLIIMGLQGGSILSKEDMVFTNSSPFAYRFYSQNKKPSIGDMEDEITDYLETKLMMCSNHLQSSKFEIQNSNRSSIKISITKNHVAFDIKYAFSVSDGKSTYYSNKRHAFEYEIAFGKMIETAVGILRRHYETAGIDLTYLTNLDYNIAMLTYDQFMVYSITDENSLIGNEPYTFMFAATKK